MEGADYAGVMAKVGSYLHFTASWHPLAIILLLMCVLFMVLGFVLYYPARKLNAAIAKSKEATGVM